MDEQEVEEVKPKPEPAKAEKKDINKDVSALRSAVNVLYERIGAHQTVNPADVAGVRGACEVFLEASADGYEEE